MTDTEGFLSEEVEKKIKAAREITIRAEAEGRKMTASERSTVENLVAEATVFRTRLQELKGGREASSLNPAGAGGGDIVDRFVKAGWNRGTNTRTEIPFADLYTGMKTISITGSVLALDPKRVAGVGLGFDESYLFPQLQSAPLDSGATTVEFLRQSSRTLLSAGSYVRDPYAVTAKAEVQSAMSIMTTNVRQIAAVQDANPNVYLARDAFRSVINNDLALAYAQDLDDYVVDQIVASTPATNTYSGGAVGTLGFLKSIRDAMAEQQALGYNGDLLALSVNDKAAYDVTSSTEDFLVASTGWLPKVVGSRSISDGVPYLIDRSAVGKLYTGPVTLAVFEENAGSTNTSLVRLEGNVAFAIERDDAILQVDVS